MALLRLGAQDGPWNVCKQTRPRGPCAAAVHTESRYSNNGEDPHTRIVSSPQASRPGCQAAVKRRDLGSVNPWNKIHHPGTFEPDELAAEAERAGRFNLGKFKGHPEEAHSMSIWLQVAHCCPPEAAVRCQPTAKCIEASCGMHQCPFK